MLNKQVAECGIAVAVANRQRRWSVDRTALRSAVVAVLVGEGYEQGEISVAVVGNRAIHKINRQYLQHDEPTDVISFVFERSRGHIDGEIVVSADTAVAQAAQHGWSVASELTLYVIHGALHLAGYDDLSAIDRRKMRVREKHYLSKMEIQIPNRARRKARSI